MPSTSSFPSYPPAPWPAMAAAFAVLLAAWLSYQNILNAPFLFDDRSAILNNPTIRDLRAWRDVLSPPNTATGATGRPLVNLSLALNHALGGLDPTGYHWFNLVLHGLGGVTLLALLQQWLRHSSLAPRFGTEALALATGGALLWTLHPLQTESVTCIIQRSELLGGLFFLLSLLCFVRGIVAQRSAGWKLGAVAAALAGVLCKEFVATVPLVAFTLDRLFFAGSWQEAWRRRRWTYAGLLGTWLLTAWVIASHDRRGGSVGFDLGVSSWDYLVTQGEAIVTYLGLAFWPHPLVLDYGSYLSPGLATAWPQFLAVTLLVVGTVGLLARGSAWAMPGVWFFCILGPSSSFVPLVTQTMAEHRMYLPLAAVVVPAVLTGYALVRRRWILGPACLVLAGVLGVVTSRRNVQYRSSLAIWADTVAKAPGNARAQLNLGQALAAEGRREEAIRHYREALRIRPVYAMAHYNLGNALAQSGDLTGAQHHFEESLRLHPAQPSAQHNLGQVQHRLGRRAEAKASFAATLRLDPAHAGAHFGLARLALAGGRIVEGVEHLQRCIELKPEHAAYRLSLAEALLGTRQTEKALVQLRAAADLAPADAASQFALGRGFLAANCPQEALVHLETAEKLKADLPGLRETLARARRLISPVPPAPANAGNR